MGAAFHRQCQPQALAPWLRPEPPRMLSFSPPLTNKEPRTINPRASRQERPAPLSPSSVLLLSVAGQRPALATAVKPRRAGLPEGHPGPPGFWPEGPAFRSSTEQLHHMRPLLMATVFPVSRSTMTMCPFSVRRLATPLNPSQISERKMAYLWVRRCRASIQL